MSDTAGTANVDPTPVNENDEATTKQRTFLSLYDETIEISFMGVLVSGITELRRLAREGVTIGDDDILTLPFSGEQLKRFFLQNKDIIHGKMREKDFLALEFILESENHFVLHEYLNQGALHHMGDENANEECVYCITTNPIRKRLTLTFRGSITVQDWLQDTKALMAELPNPLADEDDDQPETVGVHYGFREYLYNNAPSIISTAIGNAVDLTASAVTKTTKSIRTAAEKTGNTIKTAGDTVINKTTETISSLTPKPASTKGETASAPDAAATNPIASDEASQAVEEIASDPEVTTPTATEPGATESTLSFAVGKITAPISSVASKLAWKSTSSNGTEEIEPSKVELMIAQLQALIDELDGDYKVYIAGHSLGGALALIFAMEAAVQLRTPFPVTVFALGNPRTGNIDFRKVICTLEERRKLRCLCIHNEGDLVPMLPEILTTCGYLCACKRSATFRHVGMKMKISDKSMTLTYHTANNESFRNDLARQRQNIWSMFANVVCIHRWCSPSTSFAVARHFFQEYIVRLQTLEPKMEGVYIDDWYEKAYATKTDATTG